MRKIAFICLAVLNLAAHSAAAAPDVTPMPGSRTAAAPAGRGVCYWGNGAYSPGTRICVSAARLLICQDGEWQVDETTSRFTADVCQASNPRAPTFAR
ncbi:MAG: hypothetical protein JO056_10965 [Alphaproteobacteria bacterium]|nr:hypothetical protein [Alphaproteobacteria bacterium]